MLAGAGLVEGEDYETVLLDGFDPLAHIAIDEIVGFPGYKSNEPGTLDRAGIDYDLFDPADYDVPGSFGVIYTSRQFLDEHPTAAQDFVRATMRGLADALADPEAAAQSAFDLAEAGGNPSFLSVEGETFRWQTDAELLRQSFADGEPYGVPDLDLLQAEVDAYDEVGLFTEELPELTDVADVDVGGVGVRRGRRGHLAAVTNSSPMDATATFARMTGPHGVTHQPGLDGLRGLAVAAVVAFHLGIDEVSGGYLGVSLFFTLSGVLIGTLILNEIVTTGRFSLPAFWRRRARRLLPPALVTLAVVAVGRIVTADLEATTRADIVASGLNVANWHFLAQDSSYAELFGGPSAVLHFWSLAIEEQFYLVVGVLAVLLAGRTRHAGPVRVRGRRGDRGRLVPRPDDHRGRSRPHLLRQRHAGRRADGGRRRRGGVRVGPTPRRRAGEGALADRRRDRCAGRPRWRCGSLPRRERSSCAAACCR